MKLDIFSLPVFIDTVDLEKIDIGNAVPERIWLSNTLSTFSKNNVLSSETYNYLIEIFVKNLGSENLIGNNPSIGNVWRNTYNVNDWQDIHIHPKCAWSFIIYETVEESKTVFMNPNYKDIQNHWGTNTPNYPLDFRPELKPGNIIIFPSFLEHYVRPGSVGSTISGNIYMNFD